MIELKEIALKVAWTFLGIPYRWGGDDPMAGFDCSGLVIEILKSVGVLPRSGDMTAHGLYLHFDQKGYGRGLAADTCRLAFWKDPEAVKVRHVEFCISPFLTIGASGGGSAILTEKDAIRKNAYIKVRPINQKDLFCFVDPFLKL